MIEIYIKSEDKWRLLDIYDDESLNLDFKLKDLTEIEKAFSTSTQSFNVPASPTNTDIFKFYFDTDVNETKQQFYECQIFVDNDLFKKGMLSVEAAKFANLSLETYSLTFYTGLKPLKLRIGEATLADLIWDDLTVYWDIGNLSSIIDGTTNYDIKIPLISVNRPWNIGYGGPNDILQNYISISELRPAVRASRILSKIENQFDIKINLPPDIKNLVDKMYVWANREYESQNEINLIPTSSYYSTQQPLFKPIDDLYSNYPSLQNNSFGLTLLETSNPQAHSASINFKINAATNAIDGSPFTEDLKIQMQEVDQTGEVFINTATLEGARQGDGSYHFASHFNNAGRTRYFKLKLQSESPVNVSTFNVSINAINLANLSPSSNVKYQATHTSINNSVQNVGYTFDFSKSFDDIKIIDFLSSLIKTFNLKTLESKQGIYEMNWKSDFNYDEVDYTNYIDMTEYDIENQQKYKSIHLSHNEEDYYRSTIFRKAAGVEYGSEVYISDNEDLTEEYKIESGFNILSYFTVNNSNIVTSYGFDEDYKPVSPDSLTVFFANDAIDIVSTNEEGILNEIRIKDYNASTVISKYVPLHNLSSFDLAATSLTFGQEYHPIYQEEVLNNLYSKFYSAFFRQIYTNNVYLYKFKGYLTSPTMQDFSMEDSVIIGDKKYQIYEAKMNLIDGQSELTLINYLPNNQGNTIQVLPPSLFFVMDFNTTEVQLAWNGSSSTPFPVALHRLQWKESTEPNWGLYSMDVPMQANNQVSYIQTISGLFINTSYDFRIQTVDSQGNWSDWVYLSQTTENVEFITVLPPTHLILEMGAFTALHLSWWGAISQPYSIQSYKVEWKLSNSGQYSQSMTISAQTDPRQYSITGLQSNRTYNVRVKTIDSQGNESAYITQSFNTQGAFIPLPPNQIGWQVIQPSEDYQNVLFTAEFDAVDEFESLIEPNIIINLYHLDSGEETVKLLHPIDFDLVGKTKKFDFTVWDSELILDLETMENVNIKKPSEGEWSIEVAVSSLDGEISEFTRIENPIRFPLKR